MHHMTFGQSSTQDAARNKSLECDSSNPMSASQQASITAASTLQIDSRSQRSMCEYYVWLSTFICIGQYEAAFIHLHLLCCVFFRLLYHLWMWHIMLQLAADRQPTPAISPVCVSVFQCCCNLAVSPPTPHCLRALCLTCENVKAPLYSHGPPSLLLYFTVMALQFGQGFPSGYLCQLLNLPFIDLLLK